jgi:2-polyprenyl-3-methyl-5-hydroxy-6-metoxy-1,4-benzoquinol methylase
VALDTLASVTYEDPTTHTARAGTLLAQGAELAPDRPQGRVRGALRRAVLRAMGPFTHHQRELDREIIGALNRQQEILAHLSERHSEQIERLEQLARELILTAESLRRVATGAAESADATWRSVAPLARNAAEVTAELRALPYMADSPFESFGSPLGRVLGFRSRGSENGGPGSDYAAFEDLFRGPAERVRESQLPYLPLLREHQPVLDVGCGRGELLSLLAEEGIEARGVDSDAGMVERCRALDLEVAHGDANEYLQGVRDGTLGTVFSAQVIEHLPYQELRRMLALAKLKLAPGGMLIAETVNPHRVSSLKTFWVDLTHQHPIFPEVALALCGIAGFQSAYVFAPGFEDFERARFEASSYAVVALAP